MESSITENYPTVNFNGACGEASGSTPNSASSTGMEVFQQATINGGPTSNCVVGNDGAKVYGISLAKTSGVYPYQIQVDCQGPSGIFSGFFHLAFTDASGDTYYLNIYSSTRELHTVDYDSTSPNIVKIWWCDNSFSAPTAKATKPNFRVTSPAQK